jgi:hypothetical protein
VVLPVSELRVRHWQRWGSKILVKVTTLSGTLYVIREMICMGNVSEVLVLRIVKQAGLESPFGPRAKMALVGRLVSIDGEPTYP